MFKFFQLVFILLLKPGIVNLIRNFYRYFWPCAVPELPTDKILQLFASTLSK